MTLFTYLPFSVCNNSILCDIHTCKTIVNSSTCVCEEGYENTSPLQCEDVDECLDAEKNSSLCGGRNHTCVNTNGSYTCTCQEGYENAHPKFCTEEFNEIIKQQSSGREGLVFYNISAAMTVFFLSIYIIIFFVYNAVLLLNTITNAVYLWVTTEPVDEWDDMDEIGKLSLFTKGDSYSPNKHTISQAPSFLSIASYSSSNSKRASMPTIPSTPFFSPNSSFDQKATSTLFNVRAPTQTKPSTPYFSPNSSFDHKAT